MNVQNESGSRAVRLDWSRLLGFDQASRSAEGREMLGAKLGGKVGGKGVIVGMPTLAKLGAKVGGKVGTKDLSIRHGHVRRVLELRYS